MEVTTVSPSPASPTEGDDLCETDVTTMAIHIVTLLICLCGLAGNGAVLSLLSCNSGIFKLAVIDFLYLLIAILSALLLLVEDVSCTPILPLLYRSILLQLSVVSYYCGMWWLIPSSNVQYVYKLCWLCCRWELPEHLRWVVRIVLYCAFLALITVITAVTFLCPSHQQEHCRAALISMYTIILLLSFAPVLISSMINFIKAKWGSQQQQSKRRDIVIVITVLFILFLSIWNFLQQLGYIVVSPDVSFLLNCINNSIKPFIYFLAGQCGKPCSMESLRLSLQRVFEEPEENTAHSDDPAMDTGL